MRFENLNYEKKYLNYEIKYLFYEIKVIKIRLD